MATTGGRIDSTNKTPGTLCPGLSVVPNSNFPRYNYQTSRAATFVAATLDQPHHVRLPGCHEGVIVNEQKLVETIGIEPMTPCLQSRCSPS
jgi:hypothetical protein